MMVVQKALLQMWRKDPETDSAVDLNSPLMYIDRFRMRKPGTKKYFFTGCVMILKCFFALQAKDGGSRHTWPVGQSPGGAIPHTGNLTVLTSGEMLGTEVKFLDSGQGLFMNLQAEKLP